MKDFLALSTTLFLVIDAIGSIPLLFVLLKDSNAPQKILMREFFIALGIMIFFSLAGATTLKFMDLGLYSVQISGGVILFMIALQMLFKKEKE